MAQEDWRLKKEHCTEEVDETKLSEAALVAQDVPSSQPELKEVRGEHTTWPCYQHAVREPPAAGNGQGADGDGDGGVAWLHVGLHFHRRAKKPLSAEFSTSTHHLVDLVKLCTEASRAGAQDLVWAAWTPKKAKRVQHPSTYTGLLALTAEGARKLLNNWEVWLPKPESFDVALRRALCENVACRAELSAGYLYPALGSAMDVDTMLLGANPKDSTWTSPHLIQDTRTTALTAGHSSIGVCGFTTWGPACYLHPGITLPDTSQGEDFRWWTAAITIAELPAGGLPTAAKARAKAKGSGAHSQAKWVPKGLTTVLPSTADGTKDDTDSSFGEIKTSAYQIWDEAEELPAQATKSLERRWRMAVNLFHRRCFTNDRTKVAE